MHDKSQHTCTAALRSGIDLHFGASMAYVPLIVFCQDRCEAMVQAVTRRARMNNGKIDMVKEMSFFAHDVVTLVTM